jgi:hypothetical protein
MNGKHNSLASHPPVLALFQKRIEGDDALLHLASLRFKDCSLGAEFYAETPEELEKLLMFKPSPDTPAVVHLKRGLDLFSSGAREMINEFSENFKDRIFGIVIHDQIEIIAHFDSYVALLREIDADLKRRGGRLHLFIEYAVGLEPETFIRLFKTISDLEWVSSCIDTGHVGLWQIRNAFSRTHRGADIFAIGRDDPRLKDIIEDIQIAVGSALDGVLHIVDQLSRLGKPIHFHLHDGHPLAPSGSFGISDHLSFLDKIPLPFEYRGTRHIDPMFGPSGLSMIVREALRLLGLQRTSFSLEIHPTEGRLPLGDLSFLFHHWLDRGNAERMNFWLTVLCQHQKFVMESFGNGPRS